MVPAPPQVIIFQAAYSGLLSVFGGLNALQAAGALSARGSIEKKTSQERPARHFFGRSRRSIAARRCRLSKRKQLVAADAIADPPPRLRSIPQVSFRSRAAAVSSLVGCALARRRHDDFFVARLRADGSTVCFRRLRSDSGEDEFAGEFSDGAFEGFGVLRTRGVIITPASGARQRGGRKPIEFRLEERRAKPAGTYNLGR
jgi:hypothetical protein